MKFINLNLVVKINGQTNVTDCIIADGVLLTRYSNPQQGEIVFRGLKKQDETVTFEKGVLKQLYPGSTKEQIKKIVLDQIADVVKNLKSKGIGVYTKLIEHEHD